MQHNADISRFILIIGFPRSGTTWFSNLINSHPNTVYRHEVFGRQYRSFGEGLFQRLKFQGGVSDADYAATIRTVLSANIETDKPPFFPKRFRRLSLPHLQHGLWLAAHALPVLAKVYETIYTPPRHRGVTLVVKETGLGGNLDSIIAGARVNQLIVLIRHPYSVIASHIRGASAGVMRSTSVAERQQWYRENRCAGYIRIAALSEDVVINMDEPEFLALAWRLQNEEYLRLHSVHASSQVVLYDEFLKNKERHVSKLLASIGLEAEKQVFDFLRESGGVVRKNRVFKDASSRYFSVYRGTSSRQGMWRDVLTEDDRRRIDRHAGELVDRLCLNEGIATKRHGTESNCKTLCSDCQMAAQRK